MREREKDLLIGMRVSTSRLSIRTEAIQKGEGEERTNAARIEGREGWREGETRANDSKTMQLFAITASVRGSRNYPILFPLLVPSFLPIHPRPRHTCTHVYSCIGDTRRRKVAKRRSVEGTKEIHCGRNVSRRNVNIISRRVGWEEMFRRGLFTRW